MNPFLLATFQGLVKGVMMGGAHENDSYGMFEGPVVEESLYRALPHAIANAAGANYPAALSAGIFAADHLIAEEGQHDTGSALFRFADVFAGGLVYEHAFRSYGLLGAIGAHVIHNVASRVGRTHAIGGLKTAQRSTPARRKLKSRRNGAPKKRR